MKKHKKEIQDVWVQRKICLKWPLKWIKKQEKQLILFGKKAIDRKDCKLLTDQGNACPKLIMNSEIGNMYGITN